MEKRRPKLSILVQGTEAEAVPNNVYWYEPLPDGHRRLVAEMLGGGTPLFKSLSGALEGPFFVLYVLHTPRGEAEPGRYQSPPVSADQAKQFFERFQGFLEADARFDIWLHSPASNATLVWDRHNRLFAYGPLPDFEAVLKRAGFAEDLAPELGGHIHHYRAEYDDQARALMQVWAWSHSPLRPADEQR